nr:hypothetical protein [Tanacetum cinerariifolium]
MIFTKTVEAVEHPVLSNEVIRETPYAFISLKAGMVRKGLRKRLWSIVE